MKITVSLLAALSLSLSACTGGFADKDPNQTATVPFVMPTSVEGKPVMAARPVSAEEKAKLFSLLKGIPKVPSEDLLKSPPADESESAKKSREERIAKMTPEEKRDFDLLNGKCQVSGDTHRSYKLDDLKAGDTNTFNVTSIISGEECAISRTMNYHGSETIVENNFKSIKEEYEKTKDISVFDKQAHRSTSTYNIKMDTDILRELRARTGLSKFVMQMENASSSESIKNKNSNHTKGTGTLRIESVDGQVLNARMASETLTVNQVEQAYTEYSIELNGSTMDMQTYRSAEGLKAYLNGVELSPEEMKEVFGENYIKKQEGNGQPAFLN